MMKKLGLLLFTIFFAFFLVACDFDSTSVPLEDEVVEYEITYTNAILHSNSIGSVWVSAIAEVINTGTTDLFLETGSIDLEDTAGSLVKVLSMVSVYPQIISPGEKGYYYENTTVQNVSVESSLNVVLHPDIVKSKTEKINFPITDITISNYEYGGVQAIGRVENTTDEDESWLYVAIILFDSNDKPIAVLTSIPDVQAGEKKGFTATTLGLPDNIQSTSVSRFEAYAYPYQYQF